MEKNGPYQGSNMTQEFMENMNETNDEKVEVNPMKCGQRSCEKINKETCRISFPMVPVGEYRLCFCADAECTKAYEGVPISYISVLSGENFRLKFMNFLKISGFESNFWVFRHLSLKFCDRSQGKSDRSPSYGSSKKGSSFSSNEVDLSLTQM